MLRFALYRFKNENDAKPDDKEYQIERCRTYGGLCLGKRGGSHNNGIKRAEHKTYNKIDHLPAMVCEQAVQSAERHRDAGKRARSGGFNSRPPPRGQAGVMYSLSPPP